MNNGYIYNFHNNFVQFQTVDPILDERENDGELIFMDEFGPKKVLIVNDKLNYS